jgi:transposase InsO family protein
MRKNVEKFRRNCCERTHRVLTGTDALGGWKVNFKRVHRIWKEKHMQVPQKQRKRRRLLGASANGCVRHRATHRNHVWSYDFLTERTEDGRHLRILVVIDEFTRECLARACVRTPSIQKASPRELILSLPEGRVVRDQWRMDHNRRRPHGGLKWMTPAAFVAGLDGTASGMVPAASRGVFRGKSRRSKSPRRRGL